MISNSSLTRRLSAIEEKVIGDAETACMFIMPGEDKAAAMARQFGPAGPPPGARVMAFSWQQLQDEPSHGGGL